MLGDCKQEDPLEVQSVAATGQRGGFGDYLLIERRPSAIRMLAVLNGRDAEFIAASYNACLGLTLDELKQLGNGGVAAHFKRLQELK